MALKDIKVRRINDDDYLEVSEWFKSRKWPVPPSGKALPETGYVAELDGVPLSAAWLYITNSSIGIVDWLVTNPKVGPMKGLTGLKKVLDRIEKDAVENGTIIQHFFHFTPNDKLAKFLHRKCKYKTRETGVNICIREVSNG